MTFDGRRVLVVEDEFLAALTSIDVLEALGCEVIGPAARLAVALQLARSETLDAAILDINIGGEMVWPVAAELCSKNVPIVFLSAYSELDVIPMPFAAVPRLSKPLEQDRLMRRLGEIWHVSIDRAFATSRVAKIPGGRSCG